MLFKLLLLFAATISWALHRDELRGVKENSVRTVHSQIDDQVDRILEIEDTYRVNLEKNSEWH